MNSPLPFPQSKYSRAVYSCRKYLPMAARIMMGGCWLWSRSASTEAALSKSLRAMASVIWNTTASIWGMATASMSARVTRGWGE